MANPSVTIERTLHFPVWDLALEYEKIHGTLKMAVTAGLVALSRLTAEERGKIVVDLQNIMKAAKDDQPYITPRQALRNMVEHTKAHEAVPTCIIKISGPSDGPTLADIEKLLGPDPASKEVTKQRG